MVGPTFVGEEDLSPIKVPLVGNLTARSGSTRILLSSARLKVGLSHHYQEDFIMTNTDNRFPYVLVISMAGTILSLAGVWATALPIA